RDFHVTGVQTCALPILIQRFLFLICKRTFCFYIKLNHTGVVFTPSSLLVIGSSPVFSSSFVCIGVMLFEPRNTAEPSKNTLAFRSEERRVGQACTRRQA